MADATAKPRKQPESHPCACSYFSATPRDLTEQQLADGEYQVWTTGCDQSTPRTFAQGHDMKLKSFLILHGHAENDIVCEVGGFATGASAVAHAAQFGFAEQVQRGIDNAQAKVEARTARPMRVAAAERARKTPAQRKADTARVVKAVRAKPRTIKAKVGRWEYSGVVNGAGQFVYLDSSGTEHVVSRYSLL